jgi:hypothetical protein
VIRPLNSRLVRSTLAVLFIFPVMVMTAGLSVSAQDPSESILGSLRRSSRPSTLEEMQGARQEVVAALMELQNALEQRAIGTVLREELEIDRITTEIVKEPLEPAVLGDIERLLGRRVSGNLQPSLDRLRIRISDLRRRVAATPERVESLATDFDTLERHLRDPALRSTAQGELELRHAFSQIEGIHPESTDVAALRRQLSFPNVLTRVQREFVAKESEGFMVLPIDHRSLQNQIEIQAHGTLRVDYSVDLPESQGEHLVLVRVSSQGGIAASADRRRLHLRASLTPSIRGLQPIRIRAREIVGDAPSVQADIGMRLNSARLEGHLGRLPIVERAISKVVRSELEKNQSVLARQIEREVRERVEEEGFKIAYRINSLLQHRVWERFEAMQFSPELHLENNASGLFSTAMYTYSHQLGALSEPPEISRTSDEDLIAVHWFHESAVNNILQPQKGWTLDEATVRGLWQVQLKMIHPSWEEPQLATIPARIRLGDHEPMRVKVIHDGVELALNATACELHGEVQPVAPIAVHVRYQVQRGPEGLRLERQAIELAAGLAPEEQAIWNLAVDRFFPDHLRPLPRFRQSSFSRFVRLQYLRMDDGWLTVGLGRAPEQAASTHDLQPGVAP